MACFRLDNLIRSSAGSERPTDSTAGTRGYEAPRIYRAGSRKHVLPRLRDHPALVNVDRSDCAGASYGPRPSVRGLLPRGWRWQRRVIIIAIVLANIRLHGCLECVVQNDPGLAPLHLPGPAAASRKRSGYASAR